ncbi:hypothetical protein CH304_06370 [Rhodococcus sp. 15-649-1-2]|uniref:hypothetical protein n=1 Tax=Nocardiaceae TaxID=85025 RepID=UPI000522E310|nr:MULTISPECIES: hypothetical protein [Rhodococcus]OZC86129.1 hypothetical protein CH282_11800 [Rhodococcus sp. 06-418-1B]OZD11426.1 hypothetical protein CH253_29015 [Rhodococcus sp. 06-156-3C]OZD13661.1 hypothetical protein CH248_26520 [Rhodococcus sp. 06-156-4a]OZD21997.1 hypothetical protein CH280_00085 [Rhodococcus sp. 06-156-4C]OZD30285.1 hypothetical protein CH284_25100 [Rhodococcus sp. 06-156-3]
MTEPENTRRELRPQPERPEFAVEPLRPRQDSRGSSVAFRMALGAWAAVTVVALALAAVVALKYDAVRSALETSVSDDGSGATASEISDTVTVTLLGSAGVGAVLLIVAALGLSLAASGRSRSHGALSGLRSLSGVVLLVAGLAATGAFVLFWSFMSDAGSVAAGALQWAPLVGAGCAGIAAVAAGSGLSGK